MQSYQQVFISPRYCILYEFSHRLVYIGIFSNILTSLINISLHSGSCHLIFPYMCNHVIRYFFIYIFYVINSLRHQWSLGCFYYVIFLCKLLCAVFILINVFFHMIDRLHVWSRGDLYCCFTLEHLALLYNAQINDLLVHTIHILLGVPELALFWSTRLCMSGWRCFWPALCSCYFHFGGALAGSRQMWRHSEHVFRSYVIWLRLCPASGLDVHANRCTWTDFKCGRHSGL